MRQSIIFLLVILLISCSEKDTLITDDGTNIPFYRIEIEPSLSFDRSTILMVRADTQLTTLNGIYSAVVAAPIRYVEFLGETMSSPTQSKRQNIIAFLQNSKIYFYFKALDTAYMFPDDRNFQELYFINDSQLIANDESTIFITSLSDYRFDTLVAGFLPTVYLSDTLAYIQSENSNTHIINLTPHAYTPGAIQIDTIYGSRPSSFGIEPQFRRYCYSIWNGEGFEIYAGGVGIDSVWQVAVSKFSDVVMLDFDRIIYSGKDGRLYQSNFQGSACFPYWAAIDPDN